MILRLVLILILSFIVGVGFAQMVAIPDSSLRAEVEKALDKAPGSPISVTEMESLTELRASNANITDLTGLEAATNLLRLELGERYVVTEGRYINSNAISDLLPLSGLTALTRLDLNGNNISDISALSGLTNLVILELSNNSISDISALSGLSNLFFVGLWDNLISDISPLVANTGFERGEEVIVSENPLSEASINIHIPVLQSRGVEVHFSNLKPVLEEYLLSLPAGISLIHIPLKVRAVDGVPMSIESLSDLYAVLGGANRVIYLYTRDSATQEWIGYSGDSDTGTPADRELSDDLGIVVLLIRPVGVRLGGDALGVDGMGTITLNPGMNLVGLPLRDPNITHVSDLFVLEEISEIIAAVIVKDRGAFKLVNRAADAEHIPITGGQGFIIIVQQRAEVQISGDRWEN